VVPEDSSGFLKTDSSAVLTMFTAFFGAGVLLGLVCSAECKLFWFAFSWALTYAVAPPRILFFAANPTVFHRLTLSCAPPCCVVCTVPDLGPIQRGPARRLRGSTERPARCAAGDGSRHLLAGVPPRRHPGGHQGSAQGGCLLFVCATYNVLCMVMCTQFLCAGSETAFL
jgi:hypothetical protein